VSNPIYVLDSYVLLAYLNAEPGKERVVELLTQAQQGGCTTLLCTINWGEILYTVERRRGLVKAQQVQALLESLPVQSVEATRDLVLDAAHIKAKHAISYADAFVVALAVREKAVIITGDPEFESVKQLAEVEWLVTPER
jgi:predicted nucleic acid-binding protein